MLPGETQSTISADAIQVSCAPQNQEHLAPQQVAANKSYTNGNDECVLFYLILEASEKPRLNMYGKV